jgi:hypothetical protein
MTITQDWQAEFNELLMGTGQSYRIVQIEGLADYPEVRSSDSPLLQRHGLLPGDDFAGGRSVVVTLEVEGGTNANLSTVMTTLKMALCPCQTESPLTMQIPGIGDGGICRLNARPRKMSSVVDKRWRVASQPRLLVEFFATDPRIYDNTESSLQASLPVSVSGLTWNLSWNLSWGTASTSGSVYANNLGSFPTPVVIRFDGPVTNPSVENVTTGRTLELSADGGLDLLTGEHVVLDSDTHTILLGGTASRYSKLSSDSEWFDLEPGPNELRFRGTTAEAPTMTVTFRSAWV